MVEIVPWRPCTVKGALFSAHLSIASILKVLVFLVFTVRPTGTFTDIMCLQKDGPIPSNSHHYLPSPDLFNHSGAQLASGQYKIAYNGPGPCKGTHTHTHTPQFPLSIYFAHAPPHLTTRPPPRSPPGLRQTQYHLPRPPLLCREHPQEPPPLGHEKHGQRGMDY